MYKRTIVALAIVVAFLATAVAVEATDETAEGITWTEWDKTDSLWITATGVDKGWKLEADVTLTTSWNVPNDVNNLDLNGYTITFKENSTSIVVGSGATLNLYDNSENGAGKIVHEYEKDTKGIITIKYTGRGVSIDSGGEFTMNGGTICFNKDINGGGVYNAGTFTMNSGTISGNDVPNATSDYGGGGVNNEGGTFKMNGGKITGNTSANYGGGVRCSGGTFVMTDGEISGNKSSGYGGGVENRNHSIFTMSGGTISLNTSTSWGGGIRNNSGTINISGGEIKDNTVTSSHGGGISNSDTIIMSGGTICGNKATGSNSTGGGVRNGGTFTMNGGEISNNTCNTDGGGVYNTGSFTIKGGTISGNIAVGYGGGVFNNSGTFNMEKGTIEANGSSTRGGGGVNNKGTFDMVGGTICGNTAKTDGGGIRNEGTLKLSGCPLISDNYSDNGTNNAYLIKAKLPVVTGKFTSGAIIYIALEGNTGSFTSGYGDNNKATDDTILEPSKWFHSDNSDYGVVLKEGEAELSESNIVHNFDELESAITAAGKTSGTYSATIRGDVIIDAVTDIPYNMVLTIDSGSSLTNHTTTSNSGNIYNNGTITFIGTIANTGIIDNKGKICIQGDNGALIGSTLEWDDDNSFYYWAGISEPGFIGGYDRLNGNITVDTSGLVIISNPTGPITIEPASSSSNPKGLAVINTGTAQDVTIQNVHTTKHGILLVNPANVTITGCTIGSEGSDSKVSSWLNSGSGIYAEKNVRDNKKAEHTYTSYLQYITDGGGIIQIANASGDISITSNKIYGASDMNATGISTTYSATGTITISGNTLNGIGSTGIQLGSLNTGTNKVVISGNTISFANYMDSATYVGRAINISGQNSSGGSISITGNDIKPTGSSYLLDNTYNIGGVVGLNANGGAMYGIDVSGNTIKETPITATYNLANIDSGSSVYIDCGAYVSLSSALDYTTNKLYGTLNLKNGSISIDSNEVVTGLTLNNVSLRNLKTSGISVTDSALTIDGISSGKLRFASGSSATLTSVPGTVSSITSDTIAFTAASTSDASSTSMGVTNSSGLDITVNSGTMRLDGTITIDGSITLKDIGCSLVLEDSSSYWGSAPELAGTACKGWKEADGTKHASVNYTNETGEVVTAYWD